MSAVAPAPDASVEPAAQTAIGRRLWVTWQNSVTRRMHLVGRLTSSSDGWWSYCYVNAAHDSDGFRPIAHFPSLDRYYWYPELFPIFANRVMSPRRSDYPEFLKSLGLGSDATEFEILARSSGRRATDTIRLQAQPGVDQDSGLTTCRFQVHGTRHVPGAPERVDRLREGDRLTLRPEPDNPANSQAVLLDDANGEPVGYVPDLLAAYAHRLLDYHGAEVKVFRTNPLWCWLAGQWPPGPAPMTGPEFEPIPSR